jgi:hypothetical protein
MRHITLFRGTLRNHLLTVSFFFSPVTLNPRLPSLPTTPAPAPPPQVAALVSTALSPSAASSPTSPTSTSRLRPRTRLSLPNRILSIRFQQHMLIKTSGGEEEKDNVRAIASARMLKPDRNDTAGREGFVSSWCYFHPRNACEGTVLG